MLKRYAAELVGTFAIVFAPVAFAANGGAGGLLGAAAISGLIVLAMVFALGPISAAHFNPAVTLGFAVARRFPWRFVPVYWLTQFLGATLGAVCALVIFGHASGAHIPTDPSAWGRNLGTETSVTFLLMFVIIAVATDSRVPSSVPAIAIGLTVVVGVMIGGPVTGGSMNPARSFGPALFQPAAIRYYWLYAVGPCLGAIIAALAYEWIRLEPLHAKGAPNEMLEALESIDRA